MTSLSALKAGLLATLLALPMLWPQSETEVRGLEQGRFALSYGELEGADNVPCDDEAFLCPDEVLGAEVDFAELTVRSHERPCRHSRCFGAVHTGTATPMFADGVGWVELGSGAVDGCYWNTSLHFEQTPSGVSGEVRTSVNGACLLGDEAAGLVLRQSFEGTEL